MATASSSKTTIDETSQKDYTWMELRLLQLIVIQSRLGQTMLKLVDNFLWTVEKCAEWSLPRHGEDENRKDSGKPHLVRPLPWLLFLPSLVLLRVMRVTVNIGAFIFGYSQITPSGMIKFVQLSRRHLNAAMNKRKERQESKVTMTSEEKPITESKDSTEVKDSTNALEEEEEEEEETLNEKIDRLALENSEDDEDFDPTKYSSSDTSNDDDVENSDGNVSPTEILDIQNANKAFQKNLKNDIEQFLKAEQTSELAPKQEFIEPVCGKRSSAKESRDKVEERLATSQRIESPECYTPDRSSQEGDPIFYSPISSDSDAPKECSMSSVSVTEQCVSRKILKTNINGEARFISTSTTSESKSSRQINNGAVMEKRSINVSKSHKGKRTNHGNRKKK
ncbi:serine/threonine-protein kinase rio2 isoform X3 [Monomorium pharaonis]|uniref:serine/threonine-protein kinase rio2 isoform X3 n=1 Tax=Monomorium pharaonis TaxID=307658 RepID=UPI00063F0F31|nr:serine/threonine-protein kinase rio2 isoform X3 [Monomorium pharaonis]